MGIFVRGIAKHYKLGKIIGECVPSSPHTPRESCARSAVRFAPGWTGLRSAPCVHRRHTAQGVPVSKACYALAFVPGQRSAPACAAAGPEKRCGPQQHAVASASAHSWRSALANRIRTVPCLAQTRLLFPCRGSFAVVKVGVCLKTGERVALKVRARDCSHGCDRCRARPRHVGRWRAGFVYTLLMHVKCAYVKKHCNK